MSDAALLVFGVVELAGLLALFAIARRNKRRRSAGLERPARPVRIATALLGLAVVVGVPTLLVLTVRNRTGGAERLREELSKTGKSATATIRHIEETGTVINRQPEVAVWLTVQPDGEEPFDAEIAWVFSTQDVQNYRVGTKVRVLYDPRDHDRVAVVGLAVPRGAPTAPSVR